MTVGDLKIRAGRVLEEVDDISDVRVVALQCDSSEDIVPGPLHVGPELLTDGQQIPGVGVRVVAQYILQADSPDEPPRRGWGVRVVLAGVWRYEGETQFDKIDLDSFAIATGAMALHPYAREIVQSTVSRMGYPPFTLDMLRSPVTAPDEVELELTSVADQINESAGV